MPPSKTTIEIRGKKILAVEGPDDKNFFKKLLRTMGIADVQVWPVGGKDEFNQKLPGLPISTGFPNVTHLAVVRDRDDDNAFESVKNILKSEDKMDLKNVPSKPGQFGSGKPRIGVFIMPGSKIKGTMLEDLCLATVKNEPAMECVDAFMECISSLGKGPNNLSKAKSLAYLAVQPKPVDYVGLGAQRGYWNFDAPCLNELKQFLENFR